MTNDLAEGLIALRESGFVQVADLLLDLADDDTVSPEVYEKVCEVLFQVLNACAEK